MLPYLRQNYFMAKNPVKTDTKPKKTKGLSAHDLVNKQVHNENYRISDEELRNVDTSIPLTAEEERESEEVAQDVEKDRLGSPYEIMGGE